MPAAIANNLQPLGDRVILQREEADEITPGGIVLPDAAQEKQHRGKVIAVGPGTLRQGRPAADVPSNHGFWNDFRLATIPPANARRLRRLTRPNVIPGAPHRRVQAPRN